MGFDQLRLDGLELLEGNRGILEAVDQGDECYKGLVDEDRMNVYR